MKIVFGAYLHEKCIDSRKTKRGGQAEVTGSKLGDQWPSVCLSVNNGSG